MVAVSPCMCHVFLPPEVVGIWAECSLWPDVCASARAAARRCVQAGSTAQSAAQGILKSHCSWYYSICDQASSRMEETIGRSSLHRRLQCKLLQWHFSMPRTLPQVRRLTNSVYSSCRWHLQLHNVLESASILLRIYKIFRCVLLNCIKFYIRRLSLTTQFTL